MNKYCPNCQSYKGESEFTIERARKDGLATYCRECCSVRNKITRKSKARPYSEWNTDQYIEGYTTHKVCRKCKVEKPLSGFKKYPEHKKDKMGIYSTLCLPCFKIKKKEDAKKQVEKNRLKKQDEDRFCKKCDIKKTGRDFAPHSHMCLRCEENELKIDKEIEKEKKLKKQERERKKAKEENHKVLKKVMTEAYIDNLIWDNEWYCSACDKTMPMENFAPSTLKTQQYKCTKCNSSMQKKQYQKHKDEIKKKNNARYSNLTKEEKDIKAQQRKHHRENMTDEQRQKFKDTCNKYRTNKRKTNICFNLSEKISKGIKRTIRKNGESKSKYLNYTMQELKKHLESHFTSKMNWDNYGIIWDIDHYIPLNIFDFETMDCLQFRICWGLNNLYPLDSHINQNVKRGIVPSHDYDEPDQQGW